MMFRKFAILGFVAILLATCASSDKAPAIPNMVSLDEALAGAAVDIGLWVQEKTEIAVAGLNAPLNEVSEFITDELLSHLVSGGKFEVVERNVAYLAVLNTEHQFQMSGMVSDDSAVGIGHYLGAKVIITGSFNRFAGFSQLRLRALDVRSAKLLTLYTARIRPDDAVLANVMQPLDNIKPTVVTENALAYFNRGSDLIQEGKYDEAIQELDRALTINKNFAEAFSYRAFAYSKKGDNERTIADYTAAIELQPNFPAALNNRGLAYEKKGDLDRAIADFSTAINIKPDYIEALNNRGLTYNSKGNYNQAIADLNTVLRIQPDYEAALVNRGESYRL
ncbi:MAG: tetratricopeptide repeat protein [Treponema sp.]|jgi:tetratricopeptide (TPR) repeat protein|nr:tetratricopeptide repeat protein [Treponema sp.]